MILKMGFEGKQRLVIGNKVEETKALGGFEIWVREDITKSGGGERGESRGIEGGGRF